MSGFDESLHPRAADGKFGAGGGSGDRGKAVAGAARAAGVVSTTEHERAKAALSDRGFVMQHAERLSGAGDEVRNQHPRETQASDAVHKEAQSAIHQEAVRITREADAIGTGPHAERLAAALEEGRQYHAGDLAGKHEAGMARVAEESARIEREQGAIAAGHVLDVPSEHKETFVAATSKATSDFERARGELEDMHQKVADHLAEYHAIQDSLDDGVHQAPGPDLRHLDDVNTGVRDAMSEAVGRAAPDKPYEGKEHAVDGLEPPESSIHLADHIEAHLEDGATKEQAEKLGAEDHAAALAEHAEYQRAYDERRAELVAKATELQGALEDLHAKQLGTVREMTKNEKSISKAGEAMHRELDHIEQPDDLVKSSAFDGHETNDDGEFKDAGVRAAHDAATEAAETRLDAEFAERDRLSSSAPDFRDARDELSQAAKTTASAIGKIAKITGRAPRTTTARSR